MLNRLGKALAACLTVLLLLGIYILPGFSNERVTIRYDVTIDDPKSGEVKVRTTVYPTGKPHLHLFLRDPVSDSDRRIEDFQARRNACPMPFWQTIPGLSHIKTLWTGFSKQPIDLTYTAHATCGQGTKMTSYVGPDFGYLRAMNILYTPITPGDVVSFVQKASNPKGDPGSAATAGKVHMAPVLTRLLTFENAWPFVTYDPHMYTIGISYLGKVHPALNHLGGPIG